MMTDIAKLLRINFRAHWLRPAARAYSDRRTAFTMASETDVIKAADAINLAIEDLPDDVCTSPCHICQSNYAVGKEYDAQIDHRYFDAGAAARPIISAVSNVRRFWSNMTWPVTTIPFERPPAWRRRQSTGAGHRVLKAVKQSPCAFRLKSGSRRNRPHYHQLLRLQSSAAARCAPAKLHAMTEAKRMLGG